MKNNFRKWLIAHEKVEPIFWSLLIGVAVEGLYRSGKYNGCFKSGCTIHDLCVANNRNDILDDLSKMMNGD